MNQQTIKISLNQGDGNRHERADAAANRQLLLAKAASLFAAHGVPNVSMADIALAAGVGKGTLYRRFTNKADLCLALMDAQMRAFQNNVLAELRLMAGSGITPMQQLDYFLDVLVAFTAVNMPLLREVQHAGLLEAEGDTQQPYFWQYLTVRGLLKTAVAADEISPSLDIDYLADGLLAPLRVDLFRFQHEVRGYSLERISAGVRSLAQNLVM